MKEFLNDENFRFVSKEKNYWFTRTYSGLIFDDFINNNYIGIGFNKVPNKLIEAAYDEKNVKAFTELRTYIKNTYNYNGGIASKWAKQLVYFGKNMNIGDFVVIPDKNSNRLAIGEIVGDVYIVDSKETFMFNGNFEPYPEKRRKVEWLKIKDRSEFKGELGTVFSRLAIQNINHFAEVLESHISSLFVIGDVGHLAIQIKQDEAINAFHFNNFLTSLTYFYNEFCSELGIDKNEELYIKIKVQSKGNVMLSTLSISALFVVSCLFSLQSNTKVELDLKRGTIKTSGDGLLKSINDFLDAKEERRQKIILFNQSQKQILAETEEETGLKQDAVSNGNKYWESDD